MAAATLGAALLAGSGGTARADWQYSTWGMSPDQVKAASDGAAHDNADPKFDASGLKARVTASYKGAEADYHVTFLFDDKDQLSFVTLDPIGRGHCPAILRLLTSNYGQPVSVDKTDIADTSRWLDLNNNNRVLYLALSRSNCSIQYTKLPPSSPDGKT